MSKLERQLLTRLLISFLVVFTAVSGIVLFTVVTHIQNILTNRITIFSNAAESAYRSMSSTIDNQPDFFSAAQKLLADSINTSYESFFVVTPNGRLITPLPAGKDILSPAEALQWAQKALASGNAVNNFSETNIINMLHNTPLVVARPVYINQRLFATIVVAYYPIDEARAISDFFAVWIICELFAFLILSLTTRFYIRKLLRGVSLITRFVARSEQGEGNKQLILKTGNELESIAEGFNAFQTKINEKLSQQAAFTANASHQLNTPLTIIQANADILTDFDITLDEARTAGRVIAGNVARMSSTIKALLLLAQLDSVSYRQQLNLRTLNLATIIRNECSRLSILYAAKKQSLLMDVPDELTICSTEILLTQIIGNVVDNAMKYSPPAGKIQCSVTSSADVITITVQDSGPGIVATDLPHIFERFYRGDKSLSQAVAGSGLGLSIVRQIIEILGGTVTAKNANEGGAIFTIVLPVKQQYENGSVNS